ncbi:MAG: amidohydrolase [Chloroflexi bacterium]|nr:amidohydrolase [Chloroflexota bacterium]
MDYQMISVDDHIDMQYLPGDLWTTRLPASMRERGPRIEETDTGHRWVCEDRPWGPWAGAKPKVPPAPRYFKTALEKGGVFEPGVLRPTIPELRLKDMTRDNIEATVMFGPIQAFHAEDPELRVAIHRAYNEWLAEFCSYDPKRLHGAAALSGGDLEASIKEVYQLAKEGHFKQVNFLIGAAKPAIYSQEWEPFWSAIEETGLIVSFHVGGFAPGRAAGTLQQERPASVFGISKNFILAFLDPFHGLLAEGVLDHHPKVKIMLAEVGLGWIPWLVHEMDYRYQRLIDMKEYWDARGGIHVTVPPSEVWKRNFWVTFQDDPVGLAQLKFCNEDHILWASDYPHPDSTFPDSVEIVEDQMADLTPAQRKKILRDNAIKLFGLEDTAQAKAA